MSVSDLSNPIESASSHSSSPSIHTSIVRPAVPQRLARNAPMGPATPANGTVTADSVLRSFNTWAFKREQPDTIDLLRASISRSIADNRPVSFVLYWGKGVRCFQAEADIQCLNFLNSLGERIGAAYRPGATFTLIFTDTHAELNGHAAASTRQYFDEVSRSAAARQFFGCTLSELIATYRPQNVAQSIPSAALLEKLQASASRWYQGDESVSAGARRYYEMNMIEKGAVGAAFPESIFITFNGSDMRQMFPDNLPIFYMYSLKRGTSVKPWFMSAMPHIERAEEIVPAE